MFVGEVDAVLEVPYDVDALCVLHGHQLELHVGPAFLHGPHLLLDALLLDGLGGHVVDLLDELGEPLVDALAQVEVVLLGVDLRAERGAERVPVPVLHGLHAEAHGHRNELVELHQRFDFVLGNFGQELGCGRALELLLGFVQVRFVATNHGLDVVFS